MIHLSSEDNWLDYDTEFSILIGYKPARYNISLEELKNRYREIYSLKSSLLIETVFISENTSVIESRITGPDASNSSFDIRECFLSEWENNKIIKCRVYSVKIPALEDTIEGINKI